MKKLSRVLFHTFWGAPLAFALSAVATLAGCLFGFSSAGNILSMVFLVLTFLSGLLLAGAFFVSLWHRAWGRAAAQLVLGLVIAVGFAFGLPVAYFGSLAIANAAGWQHPWMESEEPNGMVPFEVEFRRALTFTSEFDRRVAFASGKRIGLVPDTGGHASLSVYALADGVYALADASGGLYRVDAKAESVDVGTHGLWFRLPDGTAEVGGRGSDGITAKLENGEDMSVSDGVPIGTSLEGRRLLGQFHPGGKLSQEADDWLEESPWQPRAGWPEDLPFKLERQTDGYAGGDPCWRVAFPFGGTVEMGGLWETPYLLNAMPDGNYALVSEWHKRFTNSPPRTPTSYRIRPAEARVDLRVGNDWVDLPPDLRYPAGSGSASVHGRTARGEPVRSTVSVPVAGTLDTLRPVGYLLENSAFAPIRQPR
jgi:hypothetical protein